MTRDHEDALMEQLLREFLGGDRPRDMTQRVLVQAKAYDSVRRWWKIKAITSIAASVAIAALIYAAWPRQYPEPKGGPGIVAIAPDKRVQPGPTITNDSEESGNLVLGGYVSVAVAPETIFTIGGTPYNEKLFLENGHIDVKVDKKKGSFDVVVGPDIVHVTGTQFSVDVADAEDNADPASAGARTMTVSVREGSVEVQGEAMPITLTASSPTGVFNIRNEFIDDHPNVADLPAGPNIGANTQPMEASTNRLGNGVPGIGSTQVTPSIDNPPPTTNSVATTPPKTSTTTRQGMPLNPTHISTPRGLRSFWKQVPSKGAFEQVGLLRYTPYTVVTESGATYMLFPPKGVPEDFKPPKAGAHVKVIWNNGKFSSIDVVPATTPGATMGRPPVFRSPMGRPSMNRYMQPNFGIPHVSAPRPPETPSSP